ncbi:MAG: hypothetical protein WCT85_00530 [Parachlamydiales bacterium]
MVKGIDNPKNQASLIRENIIDDLWSIDSKSSKRLPYNYQKAKKVAEEIISTWSLGPIGRLKSGLYWLGRKIVLFSCLKKYINTKRIASVIHSALAHCSKEEIDKVKNRHRASMSDFGDEASGRAIKKGYYKV